MPRLDRYPRIAGRSLPYWPSDDGTAPHFSSGGLLVGVADRTGRGGWTIAADRGHAGTVAFSRAGTRLAVSGADNSVWILAADNGEELLSHDQHISSPYFINSAAFSGDGKTIASARGEKAVELWDAASGETIRRFEIPPHMEDMPVPTGASRGPVVTIDFGVNPVVVLFPRTDGC